RQRKPGEIDKFHWYCQSCGTFLHEETFVVSDYRADPAPQTHALLHTRNTAFLRRSDGNKILDEAYPASHQFWGPGCTRRERDKSKMIYAESMTVVVSLKTLFLLTLPIWFALTAGIAFRIWKRRKRK
ncbi:MAG TPA: hypothetical protein VJW76_17300, partial [Verrucomicrobiae bacterium]|nr:hypothetical protein [Verrucomicrobiae bacterium]